MDINQCIYGDDDMVYRQASKVYPLLTLIKIEDLNYRFDLATICLSRCYEVPCVAHPLVLLRIEAGLTKTDSASLREQPE